MARWLVGILTVLAFGWSGIASADDQPAPTPAAAVAATTLGGRVTDVQGKPIADARVYVMPRAGGRVQTQTDKNGRYVIELGASGAYSVVIAVNQLHTYRQVLVVANVLTSLDIEVEMDLSGGEVIRIIDQRREAPAVMPTPMNDHVQQSLPYSAEAMERDAWARAWLLLDVDAKGDVARLKLLKRPGFDLDQIAIDEAFKLKFEPAKDAAGRPMATYILWNMEWPSWGWLVQGNGTAASRPVEYDAMYKYGRHTSNVAVEQPSRSFERNEALGQTGPSNRARLSTPWSQSLAVAVPQSLQRVPCLGSGPLNLDLQNRAYRDCSTPDLSNVDGLPWISRSNAKTALAEINAMTPQIIMRRVPQSHVPELVAGGVTAVFAVGIVVSFIQYNHYSDTAAQAFSVEALQAQAQQGERLKTWSRSLLTFSGAFVVSGAITAYLWSRGQTRESFSVQPTQGGAAVSFGRAF